MSIDFTKIAADDPLAAKIKYYFHVKEVYADAKADFERTGRGPLTKKEDSEELVATLETHMVETFFALEREADSLMEQQREWERKQNSLLLKQITELSRRYEEQKAVGTISNQTMANLKKAISDQKAFLDGLKENWLSNGELRDFLYSERDFMDEIALR